MPSAQQEISTRFPRSILIIIIVICECGVWLLLSLHDDILAWVRSHHSERIWMRDLQKCHIVQINDVFI